MGISPLVSRPSVAVVPSEAYRWGGPSQAPTHGRWQAVDVHGSEMPVVLGGRSPSLEPVHLLTAEAPREGAASSAYSGLGERLRGPTGIMGP